MVTRRNSKSRSEVVDDAPYGGLPIHRRPEGGNAASDGDANDQVYVQPVDMLVPIGWI